MYSRVSTTCSVTNTPLVPNRFQNVIRFIENEVRINLLGLMNTHIAAAKQMVKQGTGGRIIGAGSIASYRTAGQHFARHISSINNAQIVTFYV